MLVASHLLVFVIRLASLCLCTCDETGSKLTLTRITDPVVHGEGPHWDPTDSVLYFVDISGQGLHRYDPATRLHHFLILDEPVGLVVPVRDHKYKFVIGLGLDLVVLTWDWETNFHSISPLVSVQGTSAARFNDGKADAKGRIWAGTMGPEDDNGVPKDRGTLYRVDNNPKILCRAEPMVSPVTISNGLAWTADNKIFYYIDTPLRRVEAFDYDLASANISNRRSVFEFGDVSGSPDGMTIDSDGNLWIACWGGSQVIQVDPSSGRLLRQVKLPVERVTSVVFGGPQLDILYVTTMRLGLSPEQLAAQPQAGAVWQVTGLGVTGTPSKPAVVNCKCLPSK